MRSMSSMAAPMMACRARRSAKVIAASVGNVEHVERREEDEECREGRTPRGDTRYVSVWDECPHHSHTANSVVPRARLAIGPHVIAAINRVVCPHACVVVSSTLKSPCSSLRSTKRHVDGYIARVLQLDERLDRAEEE